MPCRCVASLWLFNDDWNYPLSPEFIISVNKMILFGFWMECVSYTYFFPVLLARMLFAIYNGIKRIYLDSSIEKLHDVYLSKIVWKIYSLERWLNILGFHFAQSEQMKKSQTSPKPLKFCLRYLTEKLK